MKPFNLLTNLVFIVLIFSMSGCYPTYEAVKINSDSIEELVEYPIQAKVFLKNDNIVIFKEGFIKEGNYLVGNNEIYDYRGIFKSTGLKISLDSIIAITQYKETTSGGSYFASALKIYYGVPLTAAAIFCLVCPKCCFGSCPTVYVPSDSNSNYVLQAELFSKCISKQLENNDLDMIDYASPSSGLIKLKITNEALETHYINKFNLYAATHSPGTKLYQSNNNDFIQIKELIPFDNAYSSSAKNISKVLKEDDNIYFRSDADKILELRKYPLKDFIEISADGFESKNKIKMLMKYRNTLLTTTLLYDVVLGSQNIKALEWTQKMNEDRIYALQFKNIYDIFSGVSIECLKNNNWVDVGKFEDPGPINWKYSVAEIPVDKDGKVKVRLSFVPDNLMIDYIAFDTTGSDEDFSLEKLNPILITDGYNQDRNDIWEFIKADDSLYLITNPGDCYNFQYNYIKPADKEVSFLIDSKGYYNEWIRGNWIRNKNTDFTFNLFDIQGTLNQLVDCWLENKDLLEQEFFNSRIPLKEAK